MKRIIIIGAGAAGLIAAGRAGELNADVLVLEKMREAGKKILVSGQERCNLTNAAPVAKFIQHYGRNGRFLRNAYHRFFRDELLTLLARFGVETQVERGGRIFPTSGRASDVRDALLRYANGYDAHIRYLTEAHRILLKQGVAVGVELQTGERLDADAIILATGGASWPSTGSTGDGYRMAQAAGHTIVPLRPALVPLAVQERALAKALQGVSLRNISCTFYTRKGEGKEKALRLPYPVPQIGEMLFTHFGVSGPLILTASLGIVDALRTGKQVTLAIDLKPGMTAAEVRQRLQREFEQHAHRRLRNLLKAWVPYQLANALAQISGIGPERHVYTICAEEREVVVNLLKDFRWNITGALPLVSAMVTAGGVALKEVDPVSFESKIVPNLHIVGEVLDLAAGTGGYNLQAAFSSGYLAGQHAAQALSNAH